MTTQTYSVILPSGTMIQIAADTWAIDSLGKFVVFSTAGNETSRFQIAQISGWGLMK